MHASHGKKLEQTKTYPGALTGFQGRGFVPKAKYDSHVGSLFDHRETRRRDRHWPQLPGVARAVVQDWLSDLGEKTGTAVSRHRTRDFSVDQSNEGVVGCYKRHGTVAGRFQTPAAPTLKCDFLSPP